MLWIGTMEDLKGGRGGQYTARLESVGDLEPIRGEFYINLDAVVMRIQADFDGPTPRRFQALPIIREMDARVPTRGADTPTPTAPPDSAPLTGHSPSRRRASRLGRRGSDPQRRARLASSRVGAAAAPRGGCRHARERPWPARSLSTRLASPLPNHLPHLVETAPAADALIPALRLPPARRGHPRLHT